MAKKGVIQDVTEKLGRKEPPPEPPLRKEDALSTGSTLLNLALSGMVEGGFFPRRYYSFVGDSGSGKTFLTLTAFAEAARNPRFAKHRLIHDNAEDGALMDFTRFFGRRTDERLEPPAGTRAKPLYSRTVQDFYTTVNRLFKAGDPFIYVLDSMDALSSDEQIQHLRKSRKAKDDEDDKAKGSYGTSKARANSAGMTELNADIRDSDSIIILISHAKMNIGKDAFFKPQTRSGGLSLKFFAAGEIWTSVGSAINTVVNDKNRKVGVNVHLKIDKNRQTGKEGRLLTIPILRDLGIDDVSACVDYLIEEKHWESGKGGMHAPEFYEKTISRDRLIRMIEDEGLEAELRMLVGEVWEGIERKCSSNRKPRYKDED